MERDKETRGRENGREKKTEGERKVENKNRMEGWEKLRGRESRGDNIWGGNKEDVLSLHLRREIERKREGV